MYRNLLVLCWLLAASCIGSAVAMAATGGSVVNVRFGVYPDKTRVVLDLDAALAYQVKPQTEPDRIVIDLRDGTLAFSSGVAPSAHGLVKAVHPDAAAGCNCLVLDLAAPAHVTQAQFLAASDNAPPRIFLDLQPGAPAGTPAAAAPSPAPPAPDAAAAADDPIARQLRQTAEAAPPPANLPVSPAASPSAAVASAGPDERQSLIAPPQPNAPPVQVDAAAVSLVALTVPATLPAPPKPAGQPSHVPVIVLDPGHGGHDPGATATDGTMEKNITLQMAKELKRTLEASGRYKVVLTRQDDTFLPLRSRIDVARAAGADLFISLHADHNDDASLRGASVYTLSETASDTEAAAVAARENKEGLIAGVDLSNQSQMVTSILVDLAQRETNNQSARFAGMLTDSLAEGTLVLPDSHRFAGFVVLKAVDVPSVLIELGYLSNEDDEAALVSSRHRARMAKAVLDAIDHFFTWQRSVRAS